MNDRTRSPSPAQPAGAHLRLVHGRAEAGTDPGPIQDLSDAYQRYAPYVAAIALRITGQDDELDDLVQDVFLDATRGIEQLREPDALRAWLARITVRACVRRLRYRRLRRALSLQREPVDYDLLASDEATPEERALVTRVYRALERLPAQERTAWVMRHVQGETLEQAADLMGCSLSTYQRRLRRATDRLEKELPHE